MKCDYVTCITYCSKHAYIFLSKMVNIIRFYVIIADHELNKNTLVFISQRAQPFEAFFLSNGLKTKFFPLTSTKSNACTLRRTTFFCWIVLPMLMRPFFGVYRESKSIVNIKNMTIKIKNGILY